MTQMKLVKVAEVENYNVSTFVRLLHMLCEWGGEEHPDHVDYRKTSIPWNSNYYSPLQLRSYIWLILWQSINAVGLDFYYFFIFVCASLDPAPLAFKIQEILNVMLLINSINPLNKHLLTDYLLYTKWLGYPAEWDIVSALEKHRD